jgi:hypothetical protein
MGEDLTQKLPKIEHSTELVLTAVQNLGTTMQSSIDNLLTWVKSMDSRLRLLERSVEERLHDTRPIWEKVLTDTGLLREGQARLEKSLRDLDRKQSVLNDSLLKLHCEYYGLDARVLDLERKPSQQNSST